MAHFGSALILAAVAAVALGPPAVANAGAWGFEAATAPASVAASSTPRITSAAQAHRILSEHGVTAIRRLGQIGDYWEAEGLVKGAPVAAYLFTNGTLSIRHYAPDLLAQAFGASPQAQETAAAP